MRCQDVIMLIVLSLFLLSVDALAGNITYTYDDAGRLIRADYGGGKVIEYEYDNAGNLTKNTSTSSGVSQFTLTVNKTGTGFGTVISSPAGIDCGSTCTVTFNQGTQVTLTATSEIGVTFTGWSGDCNSSGQVTMTANKTCTATFSISPPNPDITPTGNTITNTNPQINYTGSWYQQNTTQGSTMWSSNIGGINPSSTITLSNITGFHWMADMGPRGSSAYVYVNGRYVGMVNLYSDTNRADRVVFSATNLNPSETYTIQIVPLPTLPGFGVNVNRFIVQN